MPIKHTRWERILVVVLGSMFWIGVFGMQDFGIWSVAMAVGAYGIMDLIVFPIHCIRARRARLDRLARGVPWVRRAPRN